MIIIWGPSALSPQPGPLESRRVNPPLWSSGEERTKSLASSRIPSTIMRPAEAKAFQHPSAGPMEQECRDVRVAGGRQVRVDLKLLPTAPRGITSMGWGPKNPQRNAQPGQCADREEPPMAFCSAFWSRVPGPWPSLRWTSPADLPWRVRLGKSLPISGGREQL